MSHKLVSLYIGDGEYYTRTDADNVIADLEESHKKEVEQLLMTILEMKEKLAAPQLVMRLNTPEALYSNLDTIGRLKHETDVVARRERHQKYKRCLDNAWWCRKFSKECALSACTHRGWIIERHFDNKAELYRKWYKRWLAIAEKFKTSSTVQ